MEETKKTTVTLGGSSEPSGLRLVLDTTEIMRLNFTLGGPHVAIVERAITLGKLELIVPQIILEEVQNKYKEKVREAQDRILTEVKKLNNLLSMDGKRGFEPLDAETAAAQFAEQFSKRLVELNALRPGYTDIPQEDLVRRALERRRPFQEKGRGYRDALMWETVLRKVVASDKLTAIISQNTKDFCSEDESSALHSHLKADLEGRNLSDDAVKIYGTIGAFVDEHLKKLLPTSAEVLNQIQRGQYKMFSLSVFFRTNRDDIQERLNGELRHFRIPLPARAEIEDPEVMYVEDPSFERIREAYELDPERLFLAYSVFADCNVHFFMYKSDYYSLPDDIDFEVEDSDWNDHYILASKTVTHPSLSIWY